MGIISVMTWKLAFSPHSSPMLDFTIETNETRLLDRKFSSIDPMLKLILRKYLISMQPYMEKHI